MSALQGRLATLQEAANRRIALEADGDLVGTVSFAAGSDLGKEARACGPIGVILGEPGMRRGLRHCLQTCIGTLRFRDSQSAVNRRHGRSRQRAKGVVDLDYLCPIAMACKASMDMR